MAKGMGFDPKTSDKLLGSWNRTVAGLLSGESWDVIERDSEYRVILTDGEDRMLDRLYTGTSLAEAKLAFIRVVT